MSVNKKVNVSEWCKMDSKMLGMIDHAMICDAATWSNDAGIREVVGGYWVVAINSQLSGAISVCSSTIWLR